MIGIEIIGAQRVVQVLGEAPAKIRAAAKSSLDLWATELASYIKSEKLSGQVLHRRSGDLSASVHPIKEQTAGSTSGGAGGGRGVPYAKIHEFGFNGTEQVREYARMQTMAWGKRITPVQAIVRAHSRNMVMPKRSYMVSSFEEQAPRGIEMLRAAVKEAIVS